MRDQSGNFLAVIRVVGVGGGGTNAVNRMVDAGLTGVDFIAVNTDAQALLMCDADVKIHIGSQATRGLGAGADPVIGQAAAQESRDELKESLKGADMIVRTSAKSRLTSPGIVIRSVMPCTPWRSTSSASLKASTIEVRFSTT